MPRGGGPADDGKRALARERCRKFPNKIRRIHREGVWGREPVGIFPGSEVGGFMKIAFLGVFFRGLFSLVFGKRFGAQKVPRRTPKSSPRAPKIAPREASGPFPKRVPKKVDFWSFWGVPGTSKIELSLKRELDFHFFTLLRFWTPNGSKNGAKMEPEWSQNQLGGGLGGFPEPSQTLSKKSFEK